MSAELLAILEEVLPAQRPVALHEPRPGQRERELVDDCLDSGWISSAGAYVDRFEHELAAFTGIPSAVATVNGTAALHTCLAVAGVAPGDEVIVPALTFVGTVNPVRYLGAVPHFVDCETTTLGMDPVALEDHLSAVAELRDGRCINRETGRPVTAMIVVHVLGVPARMPALAAVAAKWHLTLVEDAAESLGSWRDGRHTGSWGQLAALSFNGNKIISTGGGGAVLASDPELAARARHLATTARVNDPVALRHDAVGYNYRLPNINAALGCAQLERLPAYLSAKRHLYERYVEAFSGIPACTLHQVPGDIRANHWLSLLLVEDMATRDDLIRQAAARDIQLRPLWDPMHSLPMFSDAPRAMLPVTRSLWERGVCLPGSPFLAS